MKNLVLGLCLALIGLEVIHSTKHQLKRYHTRDTLVNLLIGVSNILANTLYYGVCLLVYTKVYAWALMDLNGGIIYWVVLFLLTDLMLYLFHYLSHKCRFMWASHVVHHSSEYYNLSTAARSGLTNFPYRPFFLLPLCLIGFQPLHVLLMEAIIYLYTFYLHTELIGKLGWLEWIFNTPSHHRVHHGKDKQYIDKNFAAALIIWDRLFNTFAPERDTPTYGITTPLRTYNPIKIVFHVWIDIWRDLRRAGPLRSALVKLFGKP